MSPTAPVSPDPTDHAETRARVSAALHAAAARPLSPPPVTAVHRRSEARHRRHQRLVGALAATVLVLGALGTWQRLDTGDRVELAAGTTAGVEPTGLTFDWIGADTVLTHTIDVAQDADGVLYALSTAPGATYEEAGAGPVPQALYTSIDGSTWQVAGELGELHLLTLDTDGDVLYGLTTAPGVDTAFRAQMATSADGGATWSRTDLPDLARPPVNDGVQLQASITDTDTAQLGDVTVATVTTYHWVRPEGIVENPEDKWTDAGPDGLQVHADQGPDSPPSGESSPIQVIPWSDLGLQGRDDLVTTTTVRSEAGGPWEVVTPPSTGTLLMEVVDEELVAISHDPWAPTGDAPLTVSRSADGMTWVADPAPIGPSTWVTAVGRTATGLSLVVSEPVVEDGEVLETRPVIHSSGDAGRTWHTAVMDELVEVPPGHVMYLQTADVGPLGIAVAAVVAPDDGESHGATTILYSPDGQRWDVFPLDDVAGRQGQVRWLRVTADRLVVDVTDEDWAQTLVGVPRG